VEYGEAERQQGLGLQGRILPHVVFGNSSTASGATAGGSNPRVVYGHPRGLAFLYAAYRTNNIYIYPEHRDHDPGHNGAGGYGDLFPTNTPYLIISQGSSGSDQPFLRALPPVLAAFRPEVKRRLVASGLLMPTIQALLRRSLKSAPTRKDYLTGKAHPTAFEGNWVNDAKMVELAHEIRYEDIPPLVQLKVIQEADAATVRDFSDLPSERLGDTPAVIARIWHGNAATRRMVVSAEASFDLNRRPLTFHWVVLRGDADRIRLTPSGSAGAVCEIVVPWHERRPVWPGAAIESNRVDIGVFVHNGSYYSAPGFVTFFCLDDEARTTDADGRTLEVGYGLGTTDITVPDWAALLDLFRGEADSPGARPLQAALPGEQATECLKAAEEYRKARAEAETAVAWQKQAEETLKKARDDAKATGDDKTAEESVKQAESATTEAREAANAARKAVSEVLTRRRDGLKGAVQERVEAVLRGFLQDPAFLSQEAEATAEWFAKADDGTRAAEAAARKRLVAMGLLKDGPAGGWDLTPLRGPDRLTAYEKALLEQYAGAMLGQLYFGGLVIFTYNRNYVDPRLAPAKTWRDVYRYSPTGEATGWTRYDDRGPREFNRWGLLSIEKDSLGRCIRARGVKYELDAPKSGRADRWSRPSLREVVEEDVTEYEYADEKDWCGRVKAK
jgi:hypothetical protein